MSTVEKFPLIDTHVHFWDRSREWYAQKREGPSAHNDRASVFFPKDYFRDAAEAGLNPLAVVHIGAVADPRYQVAETAWVTELSKTEGAPAALIASFAPEQPDAAEVLAKHAASPLFRGVRPSSRVDYTSPQGEVLLKFLDEHGLMFEFVAQRRGLTAAAEAAKKYRNVQFVFAHLGWPKDPDEPDHFETWRRYVEAFAEQPNALCKISGLALSISSLELDRLPDYVPACLEAFGVERCFFGSDIPVDTQYGSMKTLVDGYRKIIEGCLSPADQERFWVSSAKRLYRL